MTYQDIAKMIESFGLPYTYDSFPNNIAPLPPYIVFNYPNRNDFGADNINYSKICILNIELYTAIKDFETEEKIEAILEENGFFYEKNEAFIRNEELFQITYDMQFVMKEK